jgi:hypothetical protein
MAASLLEAAPDMPRWVSAEPTARGLLVVRPIAEAEQLGWRAYMERYHYLGDSALVGESLRYAALLDGTLVALLAWGSAALHNAPRDRYVGWDATTKKANLRFVVNNVRFLLLSGTGRPHLASRVLGANLRRLSRDWQATYGHPVVLAESFVDRSRFAGTCYRASNWLCVGETQGWSKSGRKYHFNGQPKSVWLYPMRRDFKERLSTCAPQGITKERRMTLDIEKLPLAGAGGLFSVLGAITDPRKRRGIRHRVPSIVALAICATLTGAKSFIALAEWAADQSRETLTKLGAKRGKPPSERTFRRVLHSIDVDEVDRCVGEWFARQQELVASAIAIDGKTLRGSRDGEHGARHLLSAIVHGSGVVVAQTNVGNKTNEITCVKPLLANLDIEDTVVTADALLTQKAIADYIVKEKNADYVFTVKDNQPTLRQDIEALQLDDTPPSAHYSRQGPWPHREA